MITPEVTPSRVMRSIAASYRSPRALAGRCLTALFKEIAGRLYLSVRRVTRLAG